MCVKRGDIYYANLDPVIGSEQGGVRPVLIIQNDLGNRFSPTVIVLPLTSRMGKRPLRTHVPLLPPQGGVKRPSLILCEQVRTLEKSRLTGYLGRLTAEKIRAVEQALSLAVGQDIEEAEVKTEEKMEENTEDGPE
ncbi:MAG: type II toxin-antitoxin system PemK/MazF family toxin [Clostridiales bacterium]|nr:type II toxin-antitoxin system PemK/MazF family toxin [Clostridiales bacterium]